MDTLTNGDRQSLLTKYDISVEKLEPDYIGKCSNVKELEKILKILRSGEEGHYAHLESLCEERIEAINPKSRVLRKETPLLSTRDINDREIIVNDLQNWTDEMREKDMSLSSAVDYSVSNGNENLPPIRESFTGKPNSSNTVTSAPVKQKAPMPKSHREWDKIVNNLDENADLTEKKPVEEKPKSQKKYKSLPNSIPSEGLSALEKESIANREKDKGNEAFRSGDFHEAIAYYNRSLSVLSIPATFNNRALAYIRISKWSDAVRDCDEVLKSEPDNLKAKLRRACAYKSLRKFRLAKDDLDFVLNVEPNNKRAKDILKDVAKELDKDEQKPASNKSRRMVIEETDGESSDEEETTQMGSSKTAADTEKEQSSTDNSSSVQTVGEQSDSVSNEPQKKTIVIEEESESSSDEETTPPVPEESNEAVTLQNDAAHLSSTSECKSSANHAIQSEQEGSHTKKAATRSSSLYSIIQQKISQEDTSPKSSSDPKNRPRTDTSQTTSTINSLNSSAQANSQPEHSSITIIGEESNISATENSAGNISSNTDTTNTNETIDNTVSRAAAATAIIETEKRMESPSGSGSAETEERVSGDLTTKAEESVDAMQNTVFVCKSLPEVNELKTKGNEYFKAGQFSEAIKFYTQAISIISSDQRHSYHMSVLLCNRSACHLKTGDCVSALKDCTQALDLTPHNIKALLRRAAAYETMERYMKAYVDFRHVINVNPNTPNAHIGATRCENMLRMEFGTKWRQDVPKIPRGYDAPVYVFEDSEQPTVNRQEANTEAASSPSPNKAMIPPSSNKPVEPVVSSLGTASKSPTSFEAPKEKFTRLKDLGNKMVAKGNYKQAVVHYTEAIEVFSDNVASYSNRALCYLKLDSPELAMKDCDTVLALEPQHVKALFRRAQANKMLENFKESLADLMQLLKIDANNTAAKKETEDVKEAYKKQLQSLKTSTGKTSSTKAETRHVNGSGGKSSVDTSAQCSKRITIEEDSESDTESVSTPQTKGNSSRNKRRRKKRQAKKAAGAANGTSDSAPSTSTPVSVPTLSPSPTAYEFTQAWSSLKNSTSLDNYCKLIMQVPANSMAKVVSNKLEPDMLEKIVYCLDTCFSGDQLNKVEEYLKSLSTVPRLSMITMLVTSTCKSGLERLFKKIEVCSADVDKLRLAFGL